MVLGLRLSLLTTGSQSLVLAQVARFATWRGRRFCQCIVAVLEVPHPVHEVGVRGHHDDIDSVVEMVSVSVTQVRLP